MNKLADYISIFVLTVLVIIAALLVRAEEKNVADEFAAAETSAAQTQSAAIPPEPEGLQSIDELNIEIQLESDGSARIIETYTVSFTGGVFSGFVREYPLPECPLTEWSVSLDGETLSVLAASDSARPEGCAAAYQNDAGAFVEAYHRSADEKRSFAIEYTAQDAVTMFADCAEFCWTLKREDENLALKHLTATVLLPEPQGGSVSAGECNSWLHTPQGGAVTIEDGYMDFSMSDVEQNAGADIRLLLPMRAFPECSVVDDESAAMRITAEEMRR